MRTVASRKTGGERREARGETREAEGKRYSVTLRPLSPLASSLPTGYWLLSSTRRAETFNERHAFTLSEQARGAEAGLLQRVEKRSRLGAWPGMRGPESQAAGKAKGNGPDDEDAAARSHDPTHLHKPALAFGRVPPEEGVPIHDAGVEAAVFE